MQVRASFARMALVMPALLVIGGQANATPATAGFVGTIIAKGLYAPLNVNAPSNRKSDKDDKWDFRLMTKDDSDVYTVRNAIAAGANSGWHTHPGPSLVTVSLGAITVYDGDDPACSKTVYRAGEGSLDLGGGHVHLIRNESGAPAETVATQFVPRGDARRIDLPKPTNCPSF
jgi:quercetin dioxygenase-like cupin family protein